MKVVNFKLKEKPDKATFKKRLEALRTDTKRNREAALALLNERHISVRVGKHHAVCDVTVPDKGALPQHSSDFVAKYRTFVYTSKERTPSGRLKQKTLGDLWLAWEGRRSYDGTLTFAPPGADVNDEADDFNTWRGFRIKPKPGDWSLFAAHLKDNVCRGNDEWYEYLLDYFAHMVQRPGELPGVCLVIRGDQGTGKTIVHHTLKRFFHSFNHALLDNPKHVVGNFNMHLAEKIIVCADEAIFARDKQLIGKLKSMVTNPDQHFEAKGFDVVSLPNCARLIIISNDEHIIHAAHDERRYFVLRTADTYAQRPGESLMDANKRRAAYFDLITAQLDNGGAEALLYDLLRRPIGAVKLLHFPDTPFLDDQKRLSFEPHEKWLDDRLAEGHKWFTATSPLQRPPRTEVYQDMVAYAKPFAGRQPIKSDNHFGGFLRLVFGASIRKKVGQRRVYWFPALDEARRLWKAHSGISTGKLRVKVRKGGR